MKVSLFVTCLVDMFQTNVGKATVEVLERLGCEVDFPEGQICCGQPAYNSGYVTDAKKAMKRMIAAFEEAEYVVSPSGSCTTMFREYPHLFQDDPKWAAKAQQLADKTYELTDFIVNVLGVEDVGAVLQKSDSPYIVPHDEAARRVGGADEAFAPCQGARADRASRKAPMLRIRRNVFCENGANL